MSAVAGWLLLLLYLYPTFYYETQDSVQWVPSQAQYIQALTRLKPAKFHRGSCFSAFTLHQSLDPTLLPESFIVAVAKQEFFHVHLVL